MPGTTESCIKTIEAYFQFQVSQGLTIPEVIETFKQVILPAELKNTSFTEAQIRRCAQIVSTRWIINHNETIRSEMLL
jgi:hypothetical protein